MYKQKGTRSLTYLLLSARLSCRLIRHIVCNDTAGGYLMDRFFDLSKQWHSYHIVDFLSTGKIECEQIDLE